jgi:hypothetical protein
MIFGDEKNKIPDYSQRFSNFLHRIKFFEKHNFLKISTFLKIISKLPRYSGRVLFCYDHASKLVLEFSKN